MWRSFAAIGRGSSEITRWKKRKHHEHFISPPVTPYGRPKDKIKYLLKCNCPATVHLHKTINIVINNVEAENEKNIYDNMYDKLHHNIVPRGVFREVNKFYLHKNIPWSIKCTIFIYDNFGKHGQILLILCFCIQILTVQEAGINFTTAPQIYRHTNLVKCECLT